MLHDEMKLFLKAAIAKIDSQEPQGDEEGREQTQKMDGTIAFNVAVTWRWPPVSWCFWPWTLGDFK